MALPILVVLRREIELPRCAKLSTEREAPNRADARMLKLLPIEAKFTTDSADPQRANERIDNELPNCTVLITDTL
jgi:hypothetical protein